MTTNYDFGPAQVRADHTYYDIFTKGGIPSSTRWTWLMGYSVSIHPIKLTKYTLPVNFGHGKTAVAHVDITTDTLSQTNWDNLNTDGGAAFPGFWGSLDAPYDFEDGYEILRIPIVFDTTTGLSDTVVDYSGVPTRFTRADIGILDILNTQDFKLDVVPMGVVQWTGTPNKGVEIDLRVTKITI